MSGRKLVLFDVDGVLIKEGVPEIDDRWFVALKEVLGVKTSWGDLDAWGMTDGLILLALAERAGIDKSEVKKHKAELFGAISKYVDKKIAGAKIELHTGVPEMLSSLKREGHILGLLTGNIMPVAKAKLDKVDIYGFFDVGGFGDSFRPRSSLVYDAMERASEKFRVKIAKSDVVYFGDTPRDIAAGHDAGVERVVGVATGTYSTKQLLQHKPYAVLRSFKNLAKVTELIDS